MTMPLYTVYLVLLPGMRRDFEVQAVETILHDLENGYHIIIENATGERLKTTLSKSRIGHVRPWKGYRLPSISAIMESQSVLQPIAQWRHRLLR